ncbi:hypothetical protein VTJ83DRAFT_3378 [Remersonia thermophila]|uniref:CNH domain-containing protein n=1 Tax=Remersonia thermophila TaxID=72144 RepID=A0ABR4DG16_9PEZI
MASDPPRKQGRPAPDPATIASSSSPPPPPPLPPPPPSPPRQSPAALLAARPYALRPLLQDVPLAADGENGDIKINCVDYCDGNLYIGTSASELLHFFRIPPDPSEPHAPASFILARRFSPKYTEPTGGFNGSRPGVQQILLLPRVNKACVLCNWTVTFYSLPELSPVFDIQVKNCNWIGGVDLNEGHDGPGGPGDRAPGVTILLSLNRRIQVVRIGDDVRSLRKIDYAGSTLTVRRDSIACVADARSYALLDVDRQLKIPLMNISSLDNTEPDGTFGQAQTIAGAPDGGLARSASSASSRPHLNVQGHSRSTSLGDFISGMRRNDRPPEDGEDSVFQSSDAPPPPPPPSRSPGPVDKPLPAPPRGDQPADAPPQRTATPPRRATPSPKPGSVFLKPHILSPTADEFLIVTGTGPLDPGIGMFVNLDGDPTRPTLEFDKYPREIAVDGGAADLSSPLPSMGAGEEGYVLASMTKELDDGLHHGLEIQRLDANGGDGEPEKWWLEIGPDGSDSPAARGPIGIRPLLQSEEVLFEDVVERLCQRRFTPFQGPSETPTTLSMKSHDSRTALSLQRLSQEQALFDSEDEQLPPGWEATRNQEGEGFVRRLAKTTSRLAVWAGNNIWWAVRSPLLTQLDSALEAAAASQQAQGLETRRQLFALLDSIKDREPMTELEFMTLGYVKQKASVLLLTDFLSSPEPPFTDAETRAMEETLVGGDLDARVVLSLIPALRNEIVVSRRGIWIYGGIKKLVERRMSAETDGVVPPIRSLPPGVLQFLRRFLTAWRRKKGFGSIPDEVFRTVDASLLLVLLELDQSTPVGQTGKPGSVRKELYDLVDHGVDCFDRAVDLLESYHRLFVLSRLYQHRKMAADVLATWRRIIEGEEDRGGELGDGEQRVRSYLSNIGNRALVQEYGLWLASRNPRLGVQVFTDEKGKATKFEHAQIVALLREEAPDAVRYYLEHLVFGKGNTTYVNELIAYYLDVVLADLHRSPASRDTVAASYEAYRALQPPKPTYLRFLADNAPPNDEAWQSRLRLLQLLGGGHDYDVDAIRARIHGSPDGPPGFFLARPDSDGKVEEMFEALMAKRGWHQLPEKASRERQAYPIDKKWALVRADRLDEWRARERRQQAAEPGQHPPAGGVSAPLDGVHDQRDQQEIAYSQTLLVPESIILASRARHHSAALYLLVHRLADYDTAVSYCLRGAAALTPAGAGTFDHGLPRPAPRSRDADTAPPTWDEQRELFRLLLGQLLALDDAETRAEQAGCLLARFGAWFDLGEVLELLPEEWGVETVAEFLVAALRRLTAEGREAAVERALAGAENLRVGFEWVVKVEDKGGVVED